VTERALQTRRGAIAASSTGNALRKLVPAGARLFVPEHFYAECGAVLRKWGSGALLDPPRLSASIDRLLRLPVSRVQLRELFRPAWAHRHNITFADALYVALAEQVNGSLLTGDHNLAAAPTLSILVLHLSPP
jgi:predicted nucleic acid-binding protein